MVDPEARSAERDDAYQWSNGRRFKDGNGSYVQPDPIVPSP